MKLITKTSLYYLILTLVLFAAGGAVVYYLLRNIIDEEIEEHLYAERDEVTQYIQNTGELPPSSAITNDKLVIVPTKQVIREELKDTFLFNIKDQENLQYMQLKFPVKVKELNYVVIIRKPIFEWEDLIEAVSISMGIIALAMLILLFLMNRWLSGRMWKPFYATLAKLKEYEVSKNQTFQLSAVSTEEFRQLNEEIKRMTDKIQRDYKNLKEFSENASHEIQTPLAVIRSKLELLMQAQSGNGEKEEAMELVRDAYESVNRLSKLNQSLLLLTKIENRQFLEIQAVNFKELVEAKLNHFDEMIRFKDIAIEKRLNASPRLNMNLHLADVLLSNIIGNAIKHNRSGGKIMVELSDNALTVSNTGNPLNVPPEKLFERFSKDSSSPDSAGLGLAIVKQIGETYAYKVEYFFKEGVHILTISF